MSTFVPKPGQTDFTHVREVPVINSVVLCDGRILIVKRSAELNFYPGLWNGISGFLDDAKNEIEKIKEELEEEVGIGPEHISEIKTGAVFEGEDPAYGKVWLVHPLLVKVKDDAVALNDEATEYRWVLPAEIKKFKLVPGFEKVVRTFFPKA